MSKGSRREREYVELCNRAGMGTYRPATVRFGENDVMGLFDVLAFSPAHSHVHAVQVKSNRATGIRSWCRHTELFRQLGFRTLYAVPYDSEGWRVIECTAEGYQNVVDEREIESIQSHGHSPDSLGDGVVRWLKSLQSTREVEGTA